MNGIFLTGTDTGVGKTWVSAALIRTLRSAGRRVGAYKPACSGAELSADGQPLWTDLEVLQSALGCPEISLDRICPQRFAAPLAPPLAAAREGKSVDRALLTSGLRRWEQDADIVVVEGVGGLHCPMTETELLADLAAEWRLPTIVVSANRLGTISHTLLTIEAIRHREIPLLGFVMNEVTPNADLEARADHIREIENRSNARCLAAVDWNARSIPIDWLPF